MLVEKIQVQHRAIEAMIREIDGELARGALGRLPPKILALKTAVLSHVELENREFYPRLQRLAGDRADHRVHQVAQLFTQNMVVIAEGLAGFALRYEHRAESSGFHRDWDFLRGVLTRRIHDEERSLHPLFTRLEAQRMLSLAGL